MTRFSLVCCFAAALFCLPAQGSAAEPTAEETKREAETYVGLTATEAAIRLGEPKKKSEGTGPNGPFQLLLFDDTKGRETFFLVLRRDDVISGGKLRGVAFDDPGRAEGRKLCETKWAADAARKEKCIAGYRTPKSKAAVGK